ncbi:MAG: N-acetylmuramoyl-L-alanine amidase family protein [Longibaculum sp.]
MAKKKKKKLRIDRVIIAAVAVIVVLFGVYKGISFVVSQVMALFNGVSENVAPVVEHQYDGVVVLDPGHGGMDAGAKRGKLYEKNIALTTVQAIGKRLEKENIRVIYSRTSDTALHDDKATDLKMRADLSAKYKANYFVSIHVNDFDKSNDVTGYEIYTKDEVSRALATSISQSIDQLKYSKFRGLQDGKTLAVLRQNTVPSVLVEIGYIKGKDFNYLNDNQKLEKLGDKIAEGILSQIHKKDKQL